MVDKNRALWDTRFEIDSREVCFSMEKGLKKSLVIVICLVLAIVSIFLFARKFSSPEYYADIIQSIEEKVSTVLKLTATSTAASAGITAIPGDLGTPIAEQLADFSSYFLVILCVLYAEKYLLTIIGAGVFQYLIPIACGLFAIGEFYYPEALKKAAVKLTAFGIAIFLLIPLSIHVSDMIYNTFQDSIDSTITAAEELTEETAPLIEAGEDKSIIQRILSGISETAEGLTEKAAQIVNRFIESIAIMIVTCCLIPLLVLLFFLRIVKVITGIDVSLPLPKRRHGIGIHGHLDE